MRDVVVVGAGGFGREVIEVFKDQNKKDKTSNILGFVDDDPRFDGVTINNFPVLGGTDWLMRNNYKNLRCVIAIGDPKTRKDIANKLKSYGIKFCDAIHPSVILSEFIKFGEGVIVCAGAILTTNIKIGNHVIINLNCTIGHDAVIEDFCTLNPTVKINGFDHLCEGVNVGTGATFIQGITVGAWSIIGAGTVVIRDIPEKVVAVGVPAKIVRNVM